MFQSHTACTKARIMWRPYSEFVSLRTPEGRSLGDSCPNAGDSVSLRTPGGRSLGDTCPDVGVIRWWPFVCFLKRNLQLISKPSTQPDVESCSMRAYVRPSDIFASAPGRRRRFAFLRTLPGTNGDDNKEGQWCTVLLVMAIWSNYWLCAGGWERWLQVL